MSDTYLWEKLIEMARQHDRMFAHNLEGFWVEGTQIVKSNSGNYVIRPYFGDDSNWVDEDDYKKFANKYLGPHKELLIELLRKLGGEQVDS